MTNKLQDLTEKEVVFYHDNKNRVIQFRNGAHSIWLVDHKDEKLIKYLEINNYARSGKKNEIIELATILQPLRKGTTHYFKNGLWIYGKYVQFFDKKFLISDGSEYTDTLPKPVNIDYLFLIFSKTNRYEKLSPRCVIIIDPVIPGNKARYIEKTFSKRGIQVYNMDRSGALKIKV